jgi:hypothetical protein
MLGKCLSPGAVTKALDTLPKTLDETYNRILSQIDSEYLDDACRLLQWLVYSKRTMFLDELADVLTITLGPEPYFDVDSRLDNTRNVLTICSSFIQISAPEEASGCEEIRLAHSSVKDFLTSGRPTEMDQVHLSLFKQPAVHTAIAESCLAYLISINDSTQERAQITADFPLGEYPAEFWIKYAREGSISPTIQVLGLKLMRCKTSAYEN